MAFILLLLNSLSILRYFLIKSMFLVTATHPRRRETKGSPVPVSRAQPPLRQRDNLQRQDCPRHLPYNGISMIEKANPAVDLSGRIFRRSLKTPE